VSYIRQRNYLLQPNIGTVFVSIRPPQSVGVISVWFYLDEIESQRTGMCTVFVIKKPYLKAFIFRETLIEAIGQIKIGTVSENEVRIKQKCILDTNDSKDSWGHYYKVASDCTKGSR